MAATVTSQYEIKFLEFVQEDATYRNAFKQDLPKKRGYKAQYIRDVGFFKSINSSSYGLHTGNKTRKI